MDPKADTSVEIVEADSTIGDNETGYHDPYQQYPAHGGMQSGRQLSPDGGYSSPGVAGSEFHSVYHAQSQAYTAPLQPYQPNVMQPAEPLVVKYEVLDIPVKEEKLNVNKQDETTYTQPQSNFDAEKVNSRKVIVSIPITSASKLSLGHIVVNKSEQNIDSNIQQQQPNVPQTEHQVPQLPDQQKPQEKNPRETSKYEKSSIIPPTVSAVPRSPVVLDARKRRSARPSLVAASPYSCEDCGNYFASQCGLGQHRMWIHSEDRLVPCEKCGKKFLSEDELTKHMVRHEQQDKPYKCTVCPKQFWSKNDLRRHMFRHDNSAPFSCQECNRRFIRKDHLVRHLLSHERRGRKRQTRGVGSIE
ncbi:zinc finger protein 502-like [Topomyia yanbarensis]|uniref:zinc finger protein 502-like n=1 Tax=Topomyia yanbarensis TaxID=2498891 RepID=UPI00273B0E5F|nr:zinc finger protein 502-like [Topomyia yanbarensis]